MEDDPIKNFRTAFNQFLKDENLEHTYKQKQLILNWEKLMGRTISSRTTRLFFKDNVLYIKLSSAPLKQEILNSRSKVLSLVQEVVGKEVVDIRVL